MESSITQAVILAGGLGSRLKPFTDASPKPLYPIEGKPFLEHLIEQVRGFGITDVLLLLGYLPEKIIEYFGDGSRWGLTIEYSVTPAEYETGLRLKTAEDALNDEFLLMYCDNYCPIDFAKLLETHRDNNALLTCTVYRNLDGYTKSNVLVENDGLVRIYDKSRNTQGLQGVDIGYALVNKTATLRLSDENCNFESAVYPALSNEKKLYACMVEHRYYSIGSWDRIELTRKFFRLRKVIFLDRDGTLNVRPPRACYVEKPDDFVWLPGAKEAVKDLKKAGYFIIIITNQPGIARGNLTEDDLFLIHEKMQNDLKAENAVIDSIYFCPHNWNQGCPCRKPKPGMLYDAQKEFSLNLSKCILIGDDERDIEAGKAAGCQCILISEEYPLQYAVNALLTNC